MLYRLQVRAFFFNAKTDYLPYYKHFEMQLDEDAKAVEILKTVKKQNENFAYPETKLAFRINDLVATGEETVAQIVEKCGRELQIDPVTSYRADHCLIINDRDFMQHFKLLDPYAEEEDRLYYESLYALHYASESSRFNRDYCGDALLLTAYRMIANGSKYKEEILRAIDTEDALWACEYENNMFDRTEEHDKAITALKGMFERHPSGSICHKVMQKCMQKRIQPPLAETVENAHIAYYPGETENAPDKSDIFAQIKAAGGRVVRFQSEKKRAGTSLLETNPTLAYTKAATLLLDALDSGAEILVCADENALSLFKTHFGMLQKSIGREIPLALLSLSAFRSLQTQAVAA